MHYVILYVPLFDVKHRETLVSYTEHLQYFHEFLLFGIMCVDMTYNMKNIYIFAKHFVCRMAYLLYEGAIRKFKI